MVVSLLGFVDQSDGGKSIGLLHAREYIGVVADLVSEPQAERARNGHLEAETVLHVGVVGVALDQKPVDDLGCIGELVLEAWTQNLVRSVSTILYPRPVESDDWKSNALNRSSS